MIRKSVCGFPKKIMLKTKVGTRMARSKDRLRALPGKDEASFQSRALMGWERGCVWPVITRKGG